MSRQRLHKLLASAGIASRRRCEELIAEGHVSIDGVEVRQMGVLVDPEVQEIRFDEEIVVVEKPVYYAVYKPAGFLCTNYDEFGRRTVVSLIHDNRNRRLYTVGRLDEDSEGLILVTNDGDFSNRVTHPKFGLEKVYDLKLRGELTQADLDRVRKGVWLSTGKTQRMFTKVIKRSKQFTFVRVAIHEGKNRQLRRIFAKVGNAVLKLKRIRIGPVDLRTVKKGTARRLDASEVKAIEDRLAEIKKQGGHLATPPKRDENSERFSGEKAGLRHKKKRKRMEKEQKRNTNRVRRGGNLGRSNQRRR